MRLSDCTFLNIENDSSTSQEVTGAYLSEDIWGEASLLNFIAVSENAASSVFFFKLFGLSLVIRESGG